MHKVPELSLRAFTDGTPSERARFTDQLFMGLQDYGFVILKDHSVDVPLLQNAYAQAERLFALPLDIKQSYISPDGSGQRGYTPFGKEHAKGNHLPDLKEFWHVGRDLSPDDSLKPFFPDNVWPNELPEFKTVFSRLYKSLDDAGRSMLEALTNPLGVKKDYFERMTNRGSSILRLLHYPPVGSDIPSGAVRAAAHEDINLITLLVSASASGLELLTRDGQWLQIETAPENIIVDSGDMLARMTNEVIPSTTHRVVNPEGSHTSRYSMPFFMHPNPDALLTCLPSCLGTGAKYGDILANDFLLQRLREIGLTK